MNDERLGLTTQPTLRSWVETANDRGTDFPIQNLPYGVFRRAGSTENFRGGVAIGDQVLDLGSEILLQHLTPEARSIALATNASELNSFMSMGRAAQSKLRSELSRVLAISFEEYSDIRAALVPMSDAEFALPARVGDFADFYCSVYHARNVGALFRPANPLLPNYAWLPVGYHGRTSTIALSGKDVERPVGQILPPGADTPIFSPCRRLDYEGELGIFIGSPVQTGERVPVDTAENHLFGICILNDWSARDIQSWEYQPLGPFLAKSFATSLSPWVVTFDALEPFRTPLQRLADLPQPLPHLIARNETKRGAIDIKMEVALQTAVMRSRNMSPFSVSLSSYADTYWSVAQLVAHYTSGGSGLNAGDLFGSGTISGPEPTTRACLLELTGGGKDPITLPSGEKRTFLEDGDTVIMKAYCSNNSHVRIGFGECRATILAAKA